MTIMVRSPHLLASLGGTPTIVVPPSDQNTDKRYKTRVVFRGDAVPVTSHSTTESELESLIAALGTGTSAATSVTATLSESDSSEADVSEWQTADTAGETTRAQTQPSLTPVAEHIAPSIQMGVNANDHQESNEDPSIAMIHQQQERLRQNRPQPVPHLQRRPIATPLPPPPPPPPQPQQNYAAAPGTGANHTSMNPQGMDVHATSARITTFHTEIAGFMQVNTINSNKPCLQRESRFHTGNLSLPQAKPDITCEI